MASANDGDRALAGILRLLLGMAAPSATLPRSGGGGGGLVLVQHVIVDGDGDLFSGGVGGGVPPASKAAIAALKEVKAGEEGAGPLGDCAICLDGMEGAGKEMPCGHQFHRECLERWLGVHGNCPTCRHELPAAKEEGSAAAEGGEEWRWPRSALVVSYLVLGGEREEAQQQPEREEPRAIRIEDVD